MARDNRQAQSDRCAAGRRCEAEILNIIVRAIEKHKILDTEFVVEDFSKQSLPTFGSYPSVIRPDTIIRHKRTKEIVVMVGVKTSFRERWRQDDRDARLAKEFYPGVIWIEATKEDKIPNTLNEITAFDFIFSTSVPSSKEKALKGLIEHLFSKLDFSALAEV